MISRIAKSLLIISAVFIATVGATGAYFSDTKVVTDNIFSTGTWPEVPSAYISEVHYNPDEEHRGPNQKSHYEWIEIHNYGSADIPLKNWTITDNWGTGKINPNLVLPAGERALISKAANVWSHWDVSPNGGPGYIIVSLGQTIGNGLEDTGDRLTLKDASGTVVSTISWGDDQTYCNLAGVAEGMSLGYVGPGVCDYESQTPTPGS